MVSLHPWRICFCDPGFLSALGRTAWMGRNPYDGIQTRPNRGTCRACCSKDQSSGRQRDQTVRHPKDEKWHWGQDQRASWVDLHQCATAGALHPIVFNTCRVQSEACSREFRGFVDCSSGRFLPERELEKGSGLATTSASYQVPSWLQATQGCWLVDTCPWWVNWFSNYSLPRLLCGQSI